MTRILIQNRQKRWRVRTPALRRLAESLATRARASRPALTCREVALLLVDDDACAVINQAALAHNGPTDVITLRYTATPGEPEGDTAELVLNVERAWQLGRGHAAAADRELALYLAHGLDHLCGHDDATPADRRRMRRREWRWLAATGIPTLLEPPEQPGRG